MNKKSKVKNKVKKDRLKKDKRSYKGIQCHPKLCEAVKSVTWLYRNFNLSLLYPLHVAHGNSCMFGAQKITSSTVADMTFAVDWALSNNYLSTSSTGRVHTLFPLPFFVCFGQCVWLHGTICLFFLFLLSISLFTERCLVLFEGCL